MNVLVIYAHPSPKSLSAAILDQIVRGLEDGGHAATVIDLYKENFNPILVYNEDKRRSDLALDPECAHYRSLIQQADHLIFIYPVWWYGTPAILKGFIDRVLVSGFAYTYDGLFPKGLLKGKSAWVFYTIDSPGWYVRWIRRSAEWVAMGIATLKFCGIRPVKRFMLPAVKQSSENRRRQWLDRVYRQARYGLK